MSNAVLEKAMNAILEADSVQIKGEGDVILTVGDVRVHYSFNRNTIVYMEIKDVSIFDLWFRSTGPLRTKFLNVIRSLSEEFILE